MRLLPSTACKLDPFCLPDKTASTRGTTHDRRCPAERQMDTGGGECQRSPASVNRSRSCTPGEVRRPARASTHTLAFQWSSLSPPGPNLQVPVKGSQMWGGMTRRRDKDSHDSDQMVRIGRSLHSFPPSKPLMRLSPQAAFQYSDRHITCP